jgi:hypothetical protein
MLWLERPVILDGKVASSILVAPASKFKGLADAVKPFLISEKSNSNPISDFSE